MALAMYFAPDHFPREQYDTCIERLADAGQAAPSGRLYHVAFAGGDGVHVFDVWDSQESFEAFGQTLLPILRDLGVDPGAPHVAEVRNVIEG
jgi:hypothetical protein